MIVSDPKKPLNKAVEVSKLDCWCMKLCPYVLIVALFLMIVLILLILVRYGAFLTGTEQNMYYYHMGDI